MKTVILRVTGDTEVREHDKPLTLKEMQAIVGGYIEISSGLWEGAVREMVVNEDGRCIGLPLNAHATKAYDGGRNLKPPVPIVGDVFIPLDWRLS